MAGASPALDAFVVGMLPSTTRSCGKGQTVVTPAKQLLLALFFIAIGLAIDVKEVAQLKGEVIVYLPGLLFVNSQFCSR